MAVKHNYGIVNREYGMQLATTPPEADGPVLMVNLMKYKEKAVYADGEAEISGKDADDRYAPTEVLADIGATVALFGDVETQLFGAPPQWDRIGCVLYPTRRSFIEMQTRKDFQEKHVHKAAGMAETIVMGCLPIASPTPRPGLVSPDWSEVPHPPTPEDGPIVVMHVIKFADEAGSDTPDEMVAYQEAAGKVAVPHGVRIGGWYRVEGTIIGDGRSWDQVRFNLFPSKAAFMAVAADPARLEAQKAHRERAIADTYALIVRARINQLPGAL